MVVTVELRSPFPFETALPVKNYPEATVVMTHSIDLEKAIRMKKGKFIVPLAFTRCFFSYTALA